MGEDKTFAVFGGILLIRSHVRIGGEGCWVNVSMRRVGGGWGVWDSPKATVCLHYENPIPIERTTKQSAASAVIRTTTDRAAAVV